MARPTTQRLKQECDIVTPDTAVATTMAPKKNPADPTKSGTSSGKGKGRAHQPSLTPKPSDDPDEPKFYTLPDLSDNEYVQPVYSPPPKKESKRARKARIERESEQDFAVFKARCCAQQALASQEEINRLLTCQTPQIKLPGLPARKPETSSASHPTSLWSENSNQFPQVPSRGAPHPAPPLGPRNANEAPHPRHAGTNLPLRPAAAGAALTPGHPLVNCVDPPSK